MPKTKCQYDSCSARIALIIGNCKYCKHGFCASHRLPECHECKKQQQCNDHAKEANAITVTSNKCTGSKVVPI